MEMRMVPSPHAKRRGTALGLLAIIFWSTAFAFARSLTEQIGTVTAGAVLYLSAGAMGLAYAALVERRLAGMLGLPRVYLIGCGLMFTSYIVCIYLAVGLAATRQQAVEVAVINYLWPGLTLAFAIPVLGLRVRRTFAAGVLMAMAGAVLALLPVGEYSGLALAANLRDRPGPYILAFAAAVLWAAYSTLSRRWCGESGGGAVPLFLLTTGLVFLGMRPLMQEDTRWTARAVAEAAYMAALPTLLAYAFWDVAIRRGNVTLVAAMSNFTPLLATLVGVAYLGVPATWTLWLACGLVVGGAWVCQKSVVRAER